MQLGVRDDLRVAKVGEDVEVPKIFRYLHVSSRLVSVTVA